MLKSLDCMGQWMSLRENLQETTDFPMKNMGCSEVNIPLSQSIELIKQNKTTQPI